MAVMAVCLLKPLPDGQSFSVVYIISIAAESCFDHASHYDLRSLQSAVCDLLSIVNGVC